jgi:hypothetical protein
MRRLAAHPNRRWLAPLLVLAVLSAATAVASLPAQQRYSRIVGAAQARAMAERNPRAFEQAGMTADEAVEMSSQGAFAGVAAVLAIVGGVMGPIVGALAGAAALHFLGTVLGGQQTFGQMLTATAWGRLPFVFQGVARLLYAVAGGYDPRPDGLAGLVAPDPFTPFAVESPLGPLLAQVSVWNLWALGLFVVAVYAVSRVSYRKAVTAVVIYVALIVLLGETQVGIGRVLSGVGASMMGMD